jgi:hypothetical protein
MEKNQPALSLLANGGVGLESFTLPIALLPSPKPRVEYLKASDFVQLNGRGIGGGIIHQREISVTSEVLK